MKALQVGLVWLALLGATTLQGADKNVVQRIGDALSPGPLSKSHANLETTLGCMSCHSLNKGVSDLLCLDCHQEIKSRIDQRSGFHGLNKDKECLSCHGEHKGRESKIIDLGLVDHSKLKLPLGGAHLPLKCEQCHQTKFQTPAVKSLVIQGEPKKSLSFLGLEEGCNSCHGKAHGPQFEEKVCTDCHIDRGWSLTKFDHEKQSQFKLRGQHTKLNCKACHHKDQTHKDFAPFEKIDGQCSTCHFDPHQGRSGKECNSCHQPESWKKFLDTKKTSFNHDKTRFKLVGKHGQVDCEKCHKDRGHKDFRIGGFNLCTDCHKDQHQGQFAPSTCIDCHNLKGNFKQGFEHGKTKFPLETLHGEVKCAACHPKGDYQMGEKATCEGCHYEVRTVMEGKWLNAEKQPMGPDPMFRTLNCGTCHKTTEKGVSYSKVRKACVECHNEHFGDLWDYREKKYGPRKANLSKEEKEKRLKRTHRFGDFVPLEEK